MSLRARVIQALGTVFDPELAMRPGAPVIHAKPAAESRIAFPERNTVAVSCAHAAAGASSTQPIAKLRCLRFIRSPLLPGTT